VRSKDRFDPGRKRCGHLRARTICGSNVVAKLGGEICRRQGRQKIVDRGIDPIIEGQLRDWQFSRAIDIWQGDRPGLKFRIEHGAAADLFPVMILGIDPEHRNRRHVVIPRDLRRELNRGDRLEQCEKRPPKHARLLAGCNDDRARIREPRRGLSRFGGRAASCLLRRKDSSDRGIARLAVRASDCLTPGIRFCRIARIQVTQLLKIESVLADERADPFKRANVDAGRPRLVGSRRCRRVGAV
jgi:hypothetical protein